ncbi:hypothetical protein SIO70_28320 [Chitinophaga sancti]|uniref:hypothetical protein n=1 Tax=Chitinophaga sancti TaxID=1004 RepID=UPI002A75D214|nr:hypothetical protein [Chitinophaga sancti]WPQ62270.1 hypothetical protein SIO70_28320 [Chitinophaga sancti]
MPRSIRLRPQEQATQSGFFQKKQDPSFFKVNEPDDKHEKEADAVADNAIQRLATPEDKQEPATNEGRMKQDKDIQRCPCEESE